MGANDEASAGLDTSIKNQRNSAPDAYTGANDVSSYGLEQMTNHHCNMNIKTKDDSQSYEIPQKNGVPTLLVIKSPPQSYHNRPHCLLLKNIIYVSK